MKIEEYYLIELEEKERLRAAYIKAIADAKDGNPVDRCYLLQLEFEGLNRMIEAMKKVKGIEFLKPFHGVKTDKTPEHEPEKIVIGEKNDDPWGDLGGAKRSKKEEAL